jgi:hypothetical protein
MMRRYYSGTGSMISGSNGWMMGSAGYRWMFGGTTAPVWMRGAQLPSSMTRALRKRAGQMLAA